MQMLNLPAQSRIKILDYTYTSQPQINTAVPLKLHKLKLSLFILLCLLTLGFVWLLAKWTARKKAIMMYVVCPVEEATHFLIEEEDSVGATIIARRDRLDVVRRQTVVGFLYHDRNFLYHHEKEVFLPIRYQDLGIQLDRLKKHRYEPYSRRTRKKLLQYYGNNQIMLNIQSYLQVFVQQMLTPYQVFQLYAIILWLSEQYYVFPVILFAYSAYTYWETAREIVRNQRKLAQRSYFNSRCKVISKKSNKNSIEVENQRGNDSEDYTIVDQVHLQEIKEFNNMKRCDSDVDHDNKMMSEQLCQPQQQFIQNDLHTFPKNPLASSSSSNKKSLSYTIQVTQIQSKQILPGDIIILKQGDTVPCDCVLLSGLAIIDQSYISGENYLIRKVQLSNYEYSKDLEKTFLMYLGTKIVKVRNSDDAYKLSESVLKMRKEELSMDMNERSTHKPASNQDTPFAYNSQLVFKDILQPKEVACLVTQTNYNTQRGKYLRAIRYQRKPYNNFTRQSIYFIYIITAITLFIFMLLIPYIHEHVSKATMLYLFVDLLATSIPITLPTALSVGINFAQHRLKKAKIYSILPSNILSGGRATTILLDSNKILSKNYQVASIVVGSKGNSIGNTYSSLFQFLDLTNSSNFTQSVMQDPQKKREQVKKIHRSGKMLLRSFSTCHSLQKYKNQLSGSTQQKHLFQFTSAKYIDHDYYQCLGENLRVKQRLYFKQKEKKMGVVVQLQEKSKIYYESAAPVDQWKQQQTFNLNDQKQDGKNIRKKSMNADKQKIIFMKGPPEIITKICIPQTYPPNYHEYIVDLAEKGFKTVCFAYKSIPKGLDIQTNILFLNEQFIFCGFALLQAEKQHDTIQTIKQLKKSGMDVLLVSEESSLVASSLALNNKLCNKNQLLICGMSRQDNKIQCTGHMEWQSSGFENQLNQFIMEADTLFKNSYLSINSKLYEELFMKRDQQSSNYIFNKTIVYNQMEDRHSRNVYFQLDKRNKVTFAVGSGANVSQCAHLSMQLQRGECSMLSSFHTSQKSLKCITDCLIICRAALATNFHCFSMMILFSMIQFTTISILYFFHHSPTDYQQLYQDLFVTFPIFVSINLTSPAKKLSKQLPQKSFFSFKALASMIGQYLIQLITQITFINYIASLDFMESQMQRISHQFKQTGQFGSSSLTLATFILTNYLYLGTVLSTSVSKPFRQPFYTNILYTATLVILWLYNTAIVVYPQLVPQKLRPLNLTQQVQETLVLAMLLGNLIMIVMYIYENCIIWVSKLVDKIKAPKPHVNQIQIHSIKQQK